MSFKASLLTVKLQVGYELCQEHYNKLVCYDRNTKGTKRKDNMKDTAYHGKIIQEKRVRLSQETNQQLELQIKELEKELKMLKNNGSINGNVKFSCFQN